MRAALVLLLIAGMAPLATGTILNTYTDRAAWQAAATGVSTIDFAGIAPANSYHWYSTNTATIGDATFSTGTNVWLMVMDSGAFAPIFDWGSGAVLKFETQYTPNSILSVALSSGATAIALDLMSTNPEGAVLSLAFASGDTFSITTATRPTRTFFGITSDNPIAAFTIDAGRAAGLIDNLSFGTAGGPPPPPPPPPGGQTPELGVFWLVSSGVGLVLWGRRRFKKAA